MMPRPIASWTAPDANRGRYRLGTLSGPHETKRIPESAAGCRGRAGRHGPFRSRLVGRDVHKPVQRRLQIAIRASEILGVDADLRPAWKEFAENMAPLPDGTTPARKQVQ